MKRNIQVSWLKMITSKSITSKEFKHKLMLNYFFLVSTVYSRTSTTQKTSLCDNFFGHQNDPNLDTCTNRKWQDFKQATTAYQLTTTDMQQNICKMVRFATIFLYII